MSAEQREHQSVNQRVVLVKERDNALQKVTGLTKRAVTAEQAVVKVQKREQQSVREKNTLTTKLKDIKQVL